MKILAVDGNSIVNRAFYGLPMLTNKKGTPTNAILGFLNIVFKTIDEEKTDLVVFAFDRKEPTFRHEIYKEYKAGRKSMPEELATQIPILKDIISNMGYPVLEYPGFEADDILGTISHICNETDKECLLLTGDRDALQLVSEKVTLLFPTTKNKQPIDIRYDVEKIKEDYNVSPEGMIEIKALMGDSSDNIPGVKGIGEVTAKKLIAENKTVEQLYRDIDKIKLTPSIKKKLVEGEKNAILSKKLGTIRKDAPLEANIIAYEKIDGNEENLLSILKELEMFSVINRLNLSMNSTIEKKEYNQIIINNVADIKDFLLKNKENNLYLYTEFYQDIPLSIVLSDEKNIIVLEAGKISDITLFDEEDKENKEKDRLLVNCLNEIISSDVKIIVNDSKSIYRYGFANNIEISNIKFDLSLAAYMIDPLAEYYGVIRLSQQYGSYVLSDESKKSEYLSIMAEIFPILEKKLSLNEQDYLFYEVEMPLAKVLASMEIIGFEVNKQGIIDFGLTLKEQLVFLEKNIYSHAGEEFNINSPKQLGVILFETLNLPVIKKTKTGYSTNAEVLDKLKDNHPIISDILEYRQLAKLNSTYVEGFLKLIEDDGRIHSFFQQTKTRTGRISSTEPNLQNIPVRTDLGREMRRFFIASTDFTLVTADYSQIELRVLSHIAHDKNMEEAFINNEDIHTKTASQVFNVDKDMVTRKMRSDSKAVNFGIVYGISAFSLSQDIGVSVKEAQTYIDNYLANFHGVREYMKDIVEFGKKYGYVKTMFSRRRDLPELQSKNFIQRSFGERVALNMPIQGTAADIIKIAMVKVYDRLENENLKSRLILQIHDELIVETADNEILDVKNILKEEMENAVSLSVPLVVDVETGPNWYETKK